MGTQQSRQGHGRQGSRQQSQQSDRRPQQDRDVQRNKQSDRGQQRQQGDGSGREQQHAGDPGSLEHSRGANLNQQRNSGVNPGRDPTSNRSQRQMQASARSSQHDAMQDTSEVGHRSQAGMGMTRDEYRDNPAQQGKQLPSRDASLQQSQEGGARQMGHRQENEGREENRQQASERRQQSQQNVYGEGNYAASRQYNDATKDFAQSGRVEAAARAAAPRSESDAREMQNAEAEGKRHAKGEDPALARKSSSTSQTPAPRPGKEEE